MKNQPVAIVTGAAGGIGSQLAKFFAEDDYAVVVADLKSAEAEAAAAELRKSSRTAIGVELDVTDEASARSMAEIVAKEFGRIDVLINNAGLFANNLVWTGPVLDIPLDEWDAVMAVNVKGPLVCARAVAPMMRKAQWGRIVNIGSMGAHMAAGAYSASKLALNHLTWSLAIELGPDNITVNCIGPGTVDVPTARKFWPHDPEFKERIASSIVKRICRPSDIYAAIKYFVSNESEFCTAQTLLVNGGVNVHL
jgi:NAD(P)-dependent dehydrogenase (short-subunit alcohol dehydrogenase family)